MIRTTPLLFLLFACQEPIEYLETTLPQMEISNTSLDFGTIQWGTSNRKTLYVENKGELPMGLRPLTLEAEGFELDVLKGAQNSLRKIKFITADLGFELQGNTVRSFEEVDRFLSKNNFKRLFQHLDS